MNTSQDVRRDLTGAAPAAPAPMSAPPVLTDPRVREWEARPAFTDPRRKVPTLAGFLSLMPGLGQIYVGYYRQGFIHVLLAGSIITVLNSNAARNLEPLLGLFLAFFWLYNVVDAYRRATLYNLALDGLGPTSLPEEMAPPAQGSLAGGIALIALGLLIFANTMFDISMEWLRQWWPMALVGVGLYLVSLSVQAKRADKK